jgi:hypothetical protein
MTIDMVKFGAVLNARPAGREALLAIRPRLTSVTNLTLDFRGVKVLTPSFADEFITPLMEQYGSHLRLTHTQENITVQRTLAFLQRSWPGEK